MALKVAIVGLAESSRDLAPWSDPEWQLWGLAWDSARYQFHRVFEMHDMADLKDVYQTSLPGYLDKIQHCAGLHVDDAPVPGATRYPFDAVAADVGDYWNSSIGYMLALAIHEKADEIALYGVDMLGDDEYAYQRPNCEYLIGLARGRGIKVHIPDASPLCKYIQVPGREYAGRYGRTTWPQ
jgi:hypothetical protein